PARRGVGRLGVLMCLGVPGELIEVYDDAELRMGRVRFGGVVKEVCLAHVPQAVPGEYVLVHVGLALSRLDEAEAQRIFAYLETLGEADDDRPPPGWESP